MDWSKMTLQQKANYLARQMEDIKNAQDVLNRFARVSQSWLKKVSAKLAEENAKNQ